MNNDNIRRTCPMGLIFGQQVTKYAKENYKIAMEIYKKESLNDKAEEMRRQIKHIHSGVNMYSYK